MFSAPFLKLENGSPCHFDSNSIEDNPNDQFHMPALELLGHEPGAYQRPGNGTDGGERKESQIHMARCGMTKKAA